MKKQREGLQREVIPGRRKAKRKKSDPWSRGITHLHIYMGLSADSDTLKGRNVYSLWFERQLEEHYNYPLAKRIRC